MEKPVIKEVIIVEGRDDTRRLNEAVSCETIETKGSAIDDTVRDEIEVALSTRGAIIFTDPDFPGHKIRNTILERFPGIKEAFLPRDKAKGRLGGIGIEHETFDAIRSSEQKVYTNMVVIEKTVRIGDIAGWRPAGTSEAAVRRRHLCYRLNVGYANTGQQRKKLNRYNTDKARIANILEELT